MEIMSENEHVRIVRVSMTKGHTAPSYKPAALAVVRIDLRPDTHLGRVRYSEEGWPRLRVCPLGRTSMKSASS